MLAELVRSAGSTCAKLCAFLFLAGGIASAPSWLRAEQPAAPGASDRSAKDKAAKDKSARLVERDRLRTLATTLQNQGKDAEALREFENLLTIEREVLGNDHPELINTLGFIAGGQERLELWPDAVKSRDEALRIATANYGKDDWRTTDARLARKHTGILEQLSSEQRKSLRDTDTARSTGDRLSQQAKYAEAVPIKRQVVATLESILGPEHPDTATSLSELAVLYSDQGNNAAAEPLFKRSLKIREKALGPDHPGTAMSLNNLAALYWDQANYAAAEPLYLRGLKIYEKALGPDHPDTALCLNNLAVLYKYQGNTAAAEPLYQRSLKIYEKALGPDHPDTAMSLNNLAGLYLAQGNYATAEPLLKRCLTIREKSLGPDHPDTALSLNSLAALYKAQANYAAAEPLYQRSLKIWEKALGPDHPQTAKGLNNLAGLYHDQGNYSAAEPLYKRSLKIYEKNLGPNHPDTAMSLNNLAALYNDQGNTAAAEPLYQRSLKIKETALGPDHPDTAVGLNNLAALYEDQGNTAGAEPLLKRSLKICEKALGPNHPTTALSLVHLAAFHRRRHHTDSAAPLIVRAVGIRLRHLEQTAAVQTESQQFLMARTARLSIGLYISILGASPERNSECWQTLLAWKGLITNRQARARQDLKNDPLFAQFQVVSRQLSAHILNPPRPPANPAGQSAWKARESALRQAWQTRGQELEAEYERIELELARKSAVFRSTLEQRQVTPEEIQKLLAQQSEPTALVDLVEYSHLAQDQDGESDGLRIVAFVARGDAAVVRVDLGSATEIHQKIATWRETLGEGDAGRAAGAELRERLWIPLSSALKGIRTVVVSPDGELAQLPWGALPGEKPDTYLIEDVALAVLPVPQMLPQLFKEAPASGYPASLLAMGDIDYGGDAGAPGDLQARREAAGRMQEGKLFQFPRLDSAQAELASIITRYRDHLDAGGKGALQRLDKQKATEGAFRAEAPKHAWLHLITHGYFAPQTIPSALTPAIDPDQERLQFASDQKRVFEGVIPGLLSGLAFAGANNPVEADKDDGILTALEVSALDLGHVDMVVLSACETGLGPVAGGEGLLGLQRAFQVSGARTTIASLWQVPDRATAILMQKFYENLWEKKLSRIEALRQAQISFFRDKNNRGVAGTRLKNVSPTSEKRSEAGTGTAGKDGPVPPAAWAAFILSGDWR